MSRQRFGTWGTGLDDEQFACALAALGVAAVPQSLSPELGAKSATWAWRLPAPLDPPERAEVWRDRWSASTAANLRVRLELHEPYSLDVEWLVQTLARASSVTAVQLAPSGLAPAGEWDWPLDVGFLGDSASRALKQEVRDQYWARFARFVDVRRATAQVDLLLLPGTLADALAAVHAGPRLAEVYA